MWMVRSKLALHLTATIMKIQPFSMYYGCQPAPENKLNLVIWLTIGKTAYAARSNCIPYIYWTSFQPENCVWVFSISVPLLIQCPLVLLSVMVIYHPSELSPRLATFRPHYHPDLIPEQPYLRLLISTMSSNTSSAMWFLLTNSQWRTKLKFQTHFHRRWCL